jgi:hypothetical protein
MKITKSQLKQIIKEELESVINEVMPAGGTVMPPGGSIARAARIPRGTVMPPGGTRAATAVRRVVSAANAIKTGAPGATARAAQVARGVGGRAGLMRLLAGAKAYWATRVPLTGAAAISGYVAIAAAFGVLAWNVWRWQPHKEGAYKELFDPAGWGPEERAKESVGPSEADIVRAREMAEKAGWSPEAPSITTGVMPSRMRRTLERPATVTGHVPEDIIQRVGVEAPIEPGDCDPTIQSCYDPVTGQQIQPGDVSVAPPAVADTQPTAMTDDGEEAHLASLKGKSLRQRHKLNAAAMNKAVEEKGGPRGNYRDLDRDHWTRREFRKSYRELKAKRARRRPRPASSEFQDLPRTRPGGQPAATVTAPPTEPRDRSTWEKISQALGLDALGAGYK